MLPLTFPAGIGIISSTTSPCSEIGLNTGSTSAVCKMRQGIGLRRIATGGETSRAEFKSQLDLSTRDGKAKLAKYVIGIANGCKPTGYLVLGAYDDGTPSGVDHTALTEEHLQKLIGEYCEPYVDVKLKHVDVNGSPVSVIQVCRRTADVPYHAGKTAGAGPILKRGHIYYRYGRHTEEARFGEIRALFKEADRRGRGASAADDYRYLSYAQKKAAMTRDWRAALAKGGVLLSRRVYYSSLPMFPAPFYHPTVEKDVLPGTASVDGVSYAILSFVVPSAMGAELSSYYLLRRLDARSPSHLPRLRVIVVHGSVARLRGAGGRLIEVLERESFGWYAGCSSPHRTLDAHLLLENVRNRASMEQGVLAILDWLRTQSEAVNLLPDD